MSTRQYTLRELESQTGFGARSIRNYIDKGLLPGAHSRGRYASYGQGHLDRLLFLRKLKDRGRLPLDEIRRLLLQLPPEKINSIAHGREDITSIASVLWKAGMNLTADQPDRRRARDLEQPAEEPPEEPAERMMASSAAMECDPEREPDEFLASPALEFLASPAPPPRDSALDYIRRLRSPGSPVEPGSSDSRLRRAADRVRSITPSDHPPARRARGEWWATIEVTPDIELRARGLDGDDLAALESLADALRALVSRDF